MPAALAAWMTPVAPLSQWTKTPWMSLPYFTMSSSMMACAWAVAHCWQAL